MAKQEEVIELPVAFSVQNTNTSGVSCPSDGVGYTVNGHLVGPRSSLEDPAPRAVTVYLHGFNVGEYLWRFEEVPGYDYAEELAKLGHVSLTLDRLGYDSSDHPNGFQTCVGSAADVTHQIIGQLRDGISLQGRPPVSFARVVLAGSSAGGGIAEVEAYSFKDVDGLIVMVWAPRGASQALLRAFSEAGEICARGGDPAEDGTGGYFDFLSDAEIRDHGTPNTEPAVVDALLQLRNRNPCGDASSTLATPFVSSRRLGEITVPVLLAYGGQDFLYTRSGMEQHRDNYTGTTDVTVLFSEDAGHFQMLARSAPAFRSAVSDWLLERGF